MTVDNVKNKPRNLSLSGLRFTSTTIANRHLAHNNRTNIPANASKME